MPRWADFLISAAALAALAPLLGLIAIVVAVSSRGPVLYRQIRMGRNAEPFVLLKFRTMRVGSDQGGRLTIGGGDPRITPAGRWLRASKLDELPQLVNVLRGNMALVGPRPEVPEYRLRDCPAQAAVLVVRPGLTDPASIRFRHEVELLATQDDPDRYYRTVLLPAKCELSAQYLRHRTAGRDLVVLLSTVGAVSRRQGPHGPVELAGDRVGDLPV